MEKLSLDDVLEIQEIRRLLINHPLELSFFELVIILANIRINEEKFKKSLPIEKCIEPDLSDHSSDEED